MLGRHVVLVVVAPVKVPGADFARALHAPFALTLVARETGHVRVSLAAPHARVGPCGLAARSLVLQGPTSGVSRHTCSRVGSAGERRALLTRVADYPAVPMCLRGDRFWNTGNEVMRAAMKAKAHSEKLNIVTFFLPTGGEGVNIFMETSLDDTG